MTPETRLLAAAILYAGIPDSIYTHERAAEDVQKLEAALTKLYDGPREVVREMYARQMQGMAGMATTTGEEP